MEKTLTLDGDSIHDIASLYDEINRVFMAGEDWQLAASLDALDDMLYGAYGAIRGREPVTLVWTRFEKNRGDLGVEATRRFYQEKLRHPERYDTARIEQALAELENGGGPTYFDIVQEIIAGHPNIALLAR